MEWLAAVGVVEVEGPELCWAWVAWKVALDRGPWEPGCNASE